MERKDLAYLAAALLIVLALALVGKPFLMGEESPFLRFLPPQGIKVDSISTTVPLTSPIPSISPPPPTTTPPYRTYAILNGTTSGRTESFAIPFPRWILSLTAVPRLNTTANSTFIFPRLRIQVVDAENPSRIVQSIEPDLLDARIDTPYDPRPWKVEIPEGNETYYLVVYTQSVESYTIEVLVQG